MIDVSDKLLVERVSPKDTPAFFGYYDMSPESPDGKKVLINIPPFADHMPDVNDKLLVGYVNDNKEYIEIGQTTAWNFQEGCRLQWLDDDNIIYNIIVDEKIKAVVYSLSQNKNIMEFERPVYSINRKKQKALSYNLYRSRYCYAHSSDKEMTDYNNDGIFLLDLNSGEHTLLISLSDLAKNANAETVRNWVEHAVFNPLGDRFVFFHRWESEGGNFFTRFCLSDMEGNVKILLDSSACSHFGWLDDTRVTSWARVPNKINAIQKNGFLQKTGMWKVAVNIYHAIVKRPEMKQKFTNEAYVVFDTEEMTHYKIENKEFTGDGHETWSINGRFMLTDTYPDGESNRRLMLYDRETDIIFSLGNFHSFPEVNTEEYKNIPGTRCDLHPKWSYKEKYIYFDSTHEGFRGLYRIDISELMK